MTTQPIEVTPALLDEWVTNMAGPVALHLRQTLLPVERDRGIIFPPTYADIGYNIDTLADGTRLAMIDSVGSQANRLEPIFKVTAGGSRDQWLVPQIEIVLRTESCGECDACKSGTNEPEQSAEKKSPKKAQCTNPYRVTRSILDLAHRGADAVVQSCPGLADLVRRAFERVRRTGDVTLLCELVPTSLVFGVWDSRGGSGEKRPRLVRSIIRAWDVEPLHAAAQFNSVWKALDERQQEELEKEAKAKKVKLSEKGFADAPGVFRKTDKIPKYRNGAPNDDARVLGGVLAKGPIERTVTVNLVALRGLRGADDTKTAEVRKYLLGLSLVAATAEIDLFLREGCHLRYSGTDEWYAVPRRGDPTPLSFGVDQTFVAEYAAAATKPFRAAWRENWPRDGNPEYTFNLGEAKKQLSKKTEDEAPTEE